MNRIFAKLLSPLHHREGLGVGLLLALLTFAGCSKDDDTAPASEADVKARLFGTWYSQYDATGNINGKTYKSVVEVYQFPEALGQSNLGVWDRFFFAQAADEKPIDNLGGGSGSVGMFEYAVSTNGTVNINLNALYLIEYDPSLYRPFNRTATLTFNQLMVTGADGRQLGLTLADDAKEAELVSWHTYLHGGEGGGEGEVATDIYDSDAYEPSAARQFINN